VENEKDRSSRFTQPPRAHSDYPEHPAYTAGHQVPDLSDPHLFAEPSPSPQPLFWRRHQHQTVTRTQLMLGLLQMEGCGVRPVPDSHNHTQLGGSQTTTFPCCCFFTELACTAGKGQRAVVAAEWRTGAACGSASPGSGHPLPPFPYNQAGERLGCKVLLKRKSSLPLLPCQAGLWDRGAFPDSAGSPGALLPFTLQSPSPGQQ